MIHVYKSGGDWKLENGDDYTIKPINDSVLSKHLDDGWVLSVGDIKPKPKRKRKKAAKDDGNDK